MSSVARSTRRIGALAYQGFLLVRREWFRLMDVTVWPLVLFFSVALFAGFLTGDEQVIGLILLGTLGWRILYHFQLESAQLYMDNFWSGALEHLMITPLRRHELLLGGALTALVKSIAVGLLFVGCAKLLFGYTIALSFPLFAALLAIALCGIIFAIFSLGVVYLKGSDAFAFIFVITDVIAVVSGVFYPTSSFPAPLYIAAQALPTTHAFDLLKANVGQPPGSWPLFFLTSAIWLALAIAFNKWAHRKARRTGKLVKLR